MSHNLAETDGKAAMFYVGETPWHGLGHEVGNALSGAEAIKAAGLDWSVALKPVYLGNGKLIDDKFAPVRSDTGEALGVVGKNYRILENREMASLADAIIGIKDAVYQTAGALGKGERVWVLAKLPGEIRVIGDDVTHKYILFANSHDGTASFTAFFTPVRVVCNNTLNLALSLAQNAQKIRHTKNMGLQVGRVAENLGIIHQKFETFGEQARAMCAVQMTQASLRDYLKASGVISARDNDQLSGKGQAIFEQVSALFENGKGNAMAGVKGSLWGAYNGISEFVDHCRTTRGADKDAARFESSFFGTGAALKRQAWAQALELIK